MVLWSRQEGILSSPRDTAPPPSDDLRLGICDLDRQHDAMLRMLEEAGVAAEAGDLAGTRAALGAFRELVIHHFAEEERLMEESRYPDRGRHRAAHELFLQDFAQVSSGLDQGRLDDAARQLGHRVGEWLKFHVRVNDAPMAEHLAARKGGGRSKGTPSTKQPS